MLNYTIFLKRLQHGYIYGILLLQGYQVAGFPPYLAISLSALREALAMAV